MSQPQMKSLVLVVDDHVPAAEMVSRLFATRGYDTLSAYSGADALQLAQQHLPDLILLDIMMPQMDGFQVLEALRAAPATRKIPIIFITAKDEPEDIEQGLQLGADDYIPKPVKPRELIARAKSKIESYKLREALEQRTTDLEALIRFSEALNNHLEVNELLDLILYLVLDLIPCHTAIIYRLSEQGGILEVRLKSKYDDPQAEIDERGLKKYLKQRNESLRWSEGDKRAIAPNTCGMATGLQHGDQLHGYLVVLAHQGFEDNHQRLFDAIGRQTTLALRNAELYAVKVEYAERLEEMVEERTAELRSAQELLIRAEKLASVGRLAAGIAHEINNPLMPIRVNLELMAEDLQEGRAINNRDIEEALRSVNRISRIVERLQQFTRKRGEAAPAMEPLKVATVLEDVMSLSRTYIRQSGITLNVKLNEEAQIYGNRDQLEQVFLNLLLNAQAAMENGGTLTIESVIKGSKVVIRVKDTGIGIAHDMLDKIFEPFVSTKENGSGLGLFISYGIIHNHSGAIDVESQVGRGTTFTLTLPLIQD
ncbi:MAG: response regulator [Chloroflexi bacterium]|nr:response regulator [Chloroflexota bacterium]